MDKGKGVMVACQKKRQKTKDVALPREIFFNILLQHSAVFLQEQGKKVCRTWIDLINSPSFIETQLEHSNTGLLIQDLHDLYGIKFLEINKGRLTITDELVDFASYLLGTCDGLSLFYFWKVSNIFCVVNLVTKQLIELPPAPSENLKDVIASIGRDNLNKEFKVICSSANKDGTYYWLFYTVGKDMGWRRVEITHPQMSTVSFANRKWISAGGVIYGVFSLWETGKVVIAVDVSDETTWAVDVPNNDDEELGGFVELKNKLMYITPGRREEWITVYRLEDFHDSKWVKVHKFNIESNVHRLIVHGCPSAWVDNGAILLFVCPRVSRSQRIVAYNVKTRNCRILKRIEQDYEIIALTKSLIAPMTPFITTDGSSDSREGRGGTRVVYYDQDSGVELGWPPNFTTL